MHLTHEPALERLTAKPFRKGASEAEMATKIALRQTTAALVAGVKRRGVSPNVQRSLDMIAGRS